MAGYSARQSTFTTGDTITAAHSNNEFNAILAAFHVSTGHKHDGSTAGDGGPISTLFSNAISMGTGADTDIAVTFNANSNDGVITWMEDEDYFQFSDDLLLSTTEKIQFRDTAIYINSSTDGQLDLVADTEIQIAATTVDINGNVDISGSLTLGGTTITSTGAELNILDGVTATAAELNILDGVTSTTAELNILDGVTSTTAELNILDGVTSTAAELNLVDGITPGTVSASKAVIVDSNKDLTGLRNLTIAGDLTISGDDLTMATNTAGHLLIADGTNYNPTAVTDLSEISSVASGDVLLAVDASGGGLKKITRSTLVAGLATSSGIANLAEDSTPQLGGDLDVNGNGLVSTSNGNIALTPNGTGVVRIDGNVDIQTGEIVLKNGGSVSNIKFYCESSNAHYTQLQSAAHSAYSGNVTLTLPAATDTLVGKATTDTLTNKTLTTPVITEIDSGSTITLDATTDIILDADGGDIFFKDAGTTFGSATNTSGNLKLKSGTTTALTFSGANATAAGNLIVTGDLTVNGTTTTVNSTTVTIDDPIFTLGGDTAPGSDDNKDRGIEFRYHNGSAAKVGFFGYDDSAGAFTFIPDATNSSEVFSGTAGNVVFGNIAGTLTTAAQTNITSVGALDGGSISSGFGAIDTGSSNITTTGTVSGTNVAGTLTTAAQTNITSTGALDGGSITSGFGAIDNGTSGIRTNTFTAETSVVPDASGGADLGSTSLEWGDLYIADDKKIYLGSDQDVSIEYDEDGNDTTAVVAAGGISFAPHGTGTGNGTELRFQELAANGANYVGFKAPDAISSNEVWVLPNADGSDGQVLKTDGSNALSWGDAGGGGTVDMVADGAIAIRKPVIRTAAGKAKQIAETTTVASDPSTKLADLDGSDTTNSTVKTAYEPTSGKFVMLYKDTSNSSYPSIVAGTWDDNNTGSITWGTPEVLNSAATIGSGLAVTAGNGRIHATYQAGSAGSGNLNLRTATIGSDLTFSGFSTAVDTFGEDQSGTYSGTIQLAFDTSTNYLIATYSDATDGTGNFYAIPIHINGTTYTTGSASTICSGNPSDYRVGLVFDPDTNRTILAYKDNSNSGYTTVNVIQSAGTAGSPSLTVGSDVVVDSGDAGGTTSLTYDTTNNKVFLAYENSADTELKGAIGTVNSGTNSISFTTPASIKNTSADFEYFDMVYFEDQNKIYFVYRDRDDGDDLTYLIITPGASSFSVGSAVEVSANQHEVRPGSASAGVGKGVLFGLQDSGDSSKVAYLSFYNLSTTTTVLTKDNYLGVSAAAISDGATGKIVIPGGISEGHSSLTVGSRYFTNGAGTIGLAGNARGFEFIGKAISATQIQLQDREFDFYAEADGAVTKGAPIDVASGKIKAIVGNSMQFTDPTTADDTNSNGVVGHIYDVNAQRSVVYYIDTTLPNYMVSVVVNASSSGIVATGTPVVVASETAFGEGIGMATYDPDTQRQIAFWGDNGYALRSAVGTVTAGTNAISWGSVNAIGDAAHNHTQAKIAYDENVDRLVVAANRNFTGSGFAEPVGSYYVGTVTGGTTNTISWTSAKSIRGDHGGGSPGFMPEGFAYAPNIARLVLVFVDHRSNNTVETIVGTTTGGTSNSVSWTSDNTWLSSSDISNGSGITSGILTHDPDLSTGTSDIFSFVFGANYDSNDMKAVRFYFEADGTRNQSSIIDVDGNNTEASTAGQFMRWGVAYNAATNKHILTAHKTGAGAKVKELTVSGDGNTSGTISAGEYSANLSGNTSDSNYISPAYNVAAGKIIVAYNDNADSNKVKVRVNTGPAVASTKTNFDGFAQFAASDGNLVAAKLDYDIDTNQSGLTAGSTYYLDSETALTTTSTSNQKVGVALTDTDLQIVKT